MVEDGIFEPDKKNQKTFQGLFQICKSLDIEDGQKFFLSFLD